MSSFKRKRDNFDDSDEEEPAYGKQILPVANLPEDFNGEPTDGLQYLFMVRRDARQLPGTVRVDNPYDKPTLATIEMTPDEPKYVPVKLPSEDWRVTFEYRFQNFRKNLDQSTVHVGTANQGPRGLMPDKKDRDLWWAFLSGRPESEWNLSKKAKNKSKRNSTTSQGMRAWMEESSHEEPRALPYHSRQDEGEVEQVLRVDPAETLPSPVRTPVPLYYLEGLSQSSSGSAAAPYILPNETLTPREPTTELLKLIDERAALHLLMYFTHWINAFIKSPESRIHVPTECHARWIFSLLTRIDDFISPDDIHLLRNLARACVSLLKYIREQPLPQVNLQSFQATSSKQMSEGSCWIIITTIVGAWKQRDLWLDAEDVLKKIRPAT